MARHHLMYWRWNTVQINIYGHDDPRLGHSAGEQLEKIDLGDILWVVTVEPDTKQFYVVGRMVVGWKGGLREAAQRLNADPDAIWEAKWHVIAPNDHIEPFDLINITAVAGDLRFISQAGKDRLEVDPKKGVNPQQLQAMRVLEPDTAKLLDDIWYQGDDIPQGSYEFVEEAVPSDRIYIEGRRKLQTHYRRERNQKLVNEAKRAFISRHGHLYCEVCEFDFEAVYGELGESFVEAHHRQPLSEVEVDLVESSIEDLNMVCPNCHRMLHRRKPWLSIKELRQIIENQKLK